MKKLIALLLALALLCLVGCGKGDSQPATNNGTNETGDTGSVMENTQAEPTQGAVSAGEITMEELMAAPESPAEDFEVIDYGNGEIEIVQYLGDAEIVVIPESLGVTDIKAYVFANKCSARAVRLSDSVQVLDTGAFGLNANLELFVCGSGLQEIGEAAFQGCENLRGIVLNDGLTKLEEFSISGCDNLLQIEIPASVTEIDKTAFYSGADNFVIIGEAGSAAEEYAKNENIVFEAK